MSFAGKEVTGAIAMAGSANVFVNSLPAARAHADMVACTKHPGPIPIATGSGQVFINGMPAARVDDKTGCSAVITKGSGNVYIGGGTVQTDDIHPEDLVPGWVHASLLVVGVGSAIILAGPVIAVGGLIGAYAGGYGGAWAGGKIFGEGSDGQKWSAIAGSFLGGYLGAKAAPGAWEFAQRVQVNVKPGTLGMNGGNVEISLAPKATPKGTTAKPAEVASGDAATGKPPAREYKVVTKHRPGNRQVVTDGQRWHLPKGVDPESIPARDPVGNRLQELTTEAAQRWNPRRDLSPRARERIREAREEGAYWRANLLEKQAKGRWVEKQVSEAAKDEGLKLDWSRIGVDAVDSETGLRYDILSGTKSNIDDHAKRMPDEIFRMITF
ncbi:hypothetical protein C9I28_17045 [Pseudoduganella armeniaca]|uniref:Zn-binding Pro-Ala-Ala-Arg (PAAR) domain-containing protein, incolved in TypeVI secretion n=2 Tax=Pseudoduganella armeniaca TaxID=2072590 RepID=A0A2R4CIH0_9BURK|nr:hypothetical protein C9I28_17045 [Pseudoduganella armeniaca]